MPDSVDWAQYVAATSGAPPRQLLQSALGYYTRPGTAVDLGCGAGNETLVLLERGWRVYAVDSSDAALEEVSRRAAGASGLTLVQAELWDPPVPVVDLVFAGYSLFFAPPEQFPATWAAVERSVRVGGVFAGHLLGTRDDWAGAPEITAHPSSEVSTLVGGWEVLTLDEVEYDGRSSGGPKHWHLFEVVARRV